jgi:cell division protein FtsB
MKKIFEKIGGYTILLLILVLALSVFKNVSRGMQIDRQIEAEKAKITKMQAENKKLEEELIKTQNQDFIEKEIRNKLGLGKSGEAIVVLPDDDLLRKLAPQTSIETDTLPDPNWMKWKKLFF